MARFKPRKKPDVPPMMIRVEKELRDMIEDRAHQEFTSMSAVVRMAILEFFEVRERYPKRKRRKNGILERF